MGSGIRAFKDGIQGPEEEQDDAEENEETSEEIEA
jgi:Sec-independent protein translocase protein TatA